jgi:hypothetical protein
MGPRDAAAEWRIALRRCVLAVSVLDDIDALPGPDGVVLPGAPPVAVTWNELTRVVAAADPEGPAARRRVRAWLRLRRRLADLPDPVSSSRPVGLPVGHVLHPGPAWVRYRVLGGVLDVGTGFSGLLDDPDEVVVVPGELLEAAGLDDRAWWHRSLAYLDQMGTVAAERLSAEAGTVLRPIGDCDVVTLLASVAFRAALCQADPTGLRSVAVPMRRRGWLDLGRIDPAFAVAAAAATEPAERGFERPVLVTREEVVMAPVGGRPAEIVLRDPVALTPPWKRS